MHDFVLVVPRAPFASSVTLTLDLLTTAAKLACRVGVAPPRWRVCAVTPGIIELGNGLQLQTDGLPVRSSARECWILPGLDIDDASQLDARLAQRTFRLWSLRCVAMPERAARLQAPVLLCFCSTQPGCWMDAV